jgi:hypothetical protein
VEQVGGGFAEAGSGVAEPSSSAAYVSAGREEVGDVTRFEPESLASLDEA